MLGLAMSLESLCDHYQYQVLSSNIGHILSDKKNKRKDIFIFKLLLLFRKALIETKKIHPSKGVLEHIFFV